MDMKSKSDIKMLIGELRATNSNFNKFIDRYDRKDTEFRTFVKDTYKCMDKVGNDVIEIKTETRNINNKVFLVISSLIALIGAGIFGIKERITSWFIK